MKKVFINQLQEGQQVQDIFLVARKNLAETKAGKPYLSLSLMDRTGEIEARVWENAVRFDGETEVGSFIFVQAMAKAFRDQLQLGVASLQEVEGASVRLEDFMPASPRSRDSMEDEFQGILGSITDIPLLDLLRTIFQGDTMEAFAQAPAAKKMHHAYIGGLFEHTLSVTAMAERTASHYPGLDRDLLLAGGLLHDIAKIQEFDFSKLPFSYTDSGRLIGHLVLGADMVRTAASNIPELTGERLNGVLHLILSHHGQHDFGAPVLPMTPEALILHHLDDMDAKMAYMEALRGKLKGPEMQWTEYQRPLERFLYLRGPEDEHPEITGDQTVPEAEPVEEDRVRKSASRTPPDGAGKRQQSLF